MCVRVYEKGKQKMVRTRRGGGRAPLGAGEDGVANPARSRTQHSNGHGHEAKQDVVRQEKAIDHDNPAAPSPTDDGVRWKVGEQVIALDTTVMWYPAKISAVKTTKVKDASRRTAPHFVTKYRIHFDGWSSYVPHRTLGVRMCACGCGSPPPPPLSLCKPHARNNAHSVEMFLRTTLLRFSQVAFFVKVVAC